MEIQSQVSINGTDITNLIAEGGIKWTRNDLSGLMIRDRVAVKIKLQITCRDLSGTELTGLLNLIYPVFVSVTYDDPLFGTVTKTMYSNNNAATLRNIDTNEKRVWSDISFPLIER